MEFFNCHFNFVKYHFKDLEVIIKHIHIWFCVIPSNSLEYHYDISIFISGNTYCLCNTYWHDRSSPHAYRFSIINISLWQSIWSIDAFMEVSSLRCRLTFPLLLINGRHQRYGGYKTACTWLAWVAPSCSSLSLTLLPGFEEANFPKSYKSNNHAIRKAYSSLCEPSRETPCLHRAPWGQQNTPLSCLWPSDPRKLWEIMLQHCVYWWEFVTRPKKMKTLLYRLCATSLCLYNVGLSLYGAESWSLLCYPVWSIISLIVF